MNVRWYMYINVWNRHLIPIPTPIPITMIPTPIPIPITTIPTPIPTPPKRTTNDSDSDYSFPLSIDVHILKLSVIAKKFNQIVVLLATSVRRHRRSHVKHVLGGSNFKRWQGPLEDTYS